MRIKLHPEILKLRNKPHKEIRLEGKDNTGRLKEKVCVVWIQMTKDRAHLGGLVFTVKELRVP
jgi:hypothetical protein